MKSIFTFLFCMISLVFIAQADYTQFETIYLKPDTRNLATLTKNMKAHNDKYHSDNPHHANVWQVSTGPKSGWLVWSMGPCTFADLDKRPSADGHDDDWQNNVMPYILDMGRIEYWRLHADVSTPSGDPQPLLKLRFYQLKPGMGFLLGDLWEKMGKVRKEMPEGRSWGLYSNLTQQGDQGRHFAGVTPFANWGELDNGMNLDPAFGGSFRPTFEKLYGEAAWTSFTDALGAAILNSYDEIWALLPNMSAPPSQ